jgi:hypothetical protein
MATESTESTEILKILHVGCAVRTGVMATEAHGSTRKYTEGIQIYIQHTHGVSCEWCVMRDLFC